MNAVFLDRGSFPPEITIECPVGVIDWQLYHNTQAEQVLERCRDADIVFTNKVCLDHAALLALPRLKLIAVTATGTNNIDLETCRERNIRVVNATGYGTASVAEHALLLMLALSRKLPAYIAANQQQQWARSAFFCDLVAPMRTLDGKILALVGAGTLGRAVAERARAFGMQVLLAERPQAETVRPGYSAFESALAQADYLSLHCPLTDQTRELINRTTLALMKPTAILINTGRGALVNEADLLAALGAQRLAGAGLDVASTEPPSPDDLIWQLAAQTNVIVTPHIAWAADEAMNNLMMQIVTKVSQFVAHHNSPTEHSAPVGL
ncbi:D-2-hydroxyacid dehydrogenase [Reinekea sp.]|uniref:D-2-hydroxyacid dehydrogenase n=1 Tax=Reinekea sp. TaxID=1970455 RepID=UPI002A8310EA|nr:D-2-hydroxyacid dehydrogenase [Reinekea sp.]